MRILHLAFAYLASRPLLTALNVAMLALGVATIAFLLLVTAQVEERLSRDARSVDLVVGAKGSPSNCWGTGFHGQRRRRGRRLLGPLDHRPPPCPEPRKTE